MTDHTSTGRTMGRIALLLAALGLLAACGKEGDPRLKPGKADSYPRSYPDGSQGREPNIFHQRGPGRGVD